MVDLSLTSKLSETSFKSEDNIEKLGLMIYMGASNLKV